MKNKPLPTQTPSRFDRHDVLIVTGLVLLGYGLAQVSPALASGVVGGILTAVGLVGAWRKGGV